MRRTRLFNTTIIYLVILVLFVILRIIFSSATINLDETTQDIIFTCCSQILIMLLFPLFSYKFAQKTNFKQTLYDFNVRKTSFSVILISILIGIVAFFLNIAFSSFFNGLISLFGYEAVPTVPGVDPPVTFNMFLLIFVLIAIMPAICEEFTHRGLLLNGLGSLGLKRAVILSSVMFGLMHLNISQVFYATILGFMMAIAVIMSKSIFPAIIIHFINNFINVYLEFAQDNGYFGHNFTQIVNDLLNGQGMFIGFVMCFIVLVCLALITLSLYFILLKQTRIKNLQKVFNDIARIDTDANSTKSDYLKNLATLNAMLTQHNLNKPTNLVFTVQENTYNKPSAIESLLLFSILLLGSIVTIFTFVWGFL